MRRAHRFAFVSYITLMIDITTPLWRITIIWSPWIKDQLPTREYITNQVSESYKFKIASEKLLQRLRSHDNPDDPEAIIPLRSLDAQKFRDRLHLQLDIYKTETDGRVEARSIKSEREILVMREYNALQGRRWSVAKIARKLDMSYDMVREVVRKYNKKK